MKQIKYLFMTLLMLPLFAACSSDEDDILDSNSEMATRTDQQESDYYWAGTHKNYYRVLEGKVFIYYHPGNEEILYQKLAERGIEIIRDRPIYPLGSGVNYRANLGEKSDFLCECIGTGIAADYESILDIPEIIGACPYVYLEDFGEAPGTCLIMIQSSDMLTLQKIADEFNIQIIGTTYDYGQTISYMFCEKGSKGNALEICRNIIDNGMIRKGAFAEPALMAGRLD